MRIQIHRIKKLEYDWRKVFTLRYEAIEFEINIIVDNRKRLKYVYHWKGSVIENQIWLKMQHQWKPYVIDASCERLPDALTG